MTLLNPIIGVLPDFQNGAENTYSKKDFYAIRKNYIDGISDAGGLPIIMTYDYEKIDDYLAIIDGLMVVGGYMDIHPKRYNEEYIHPTVKLNLTRENFEYEFVKRALKTNLPIFGICNGMQLISVLHGGKIIQHILDEKNFMDHDQSEYPDNCKYIDHEQSHFTEFKEYGNPYHDINIEKNSQFYQIVQNEKFATNSSHHQAIKSVGDDLKVVAKADDGIIEAFEKPNHPFCIGVQWHPEFQTSPADKKLFKEFVNQANNYKKIKFNHG